MKARLVRVFFGLFVKLLLTQFALATILRPADCVFNNLTQWGGTMEIKIEIDEYELVVDCSEDDGTPYVTSGLIFDEEGISRKLTEPECMVVGFKLSGLIEMHAEAAFKKRTEEAEEDAGAEQGERLAYYREAC